MPSGKDNGCKAADISASRNEAGDFSKTNLTAETAENAENG
jgi:hypothetical protein